MPRRTIVMEEILPGLFRLEIPLPDNPLKYVNSYVIKASDRCLVIDTGLNRDECYEAMTTGLKKLSIDMDRTYFFITHLHADHFGLVARLTQEPGRVYFSRPETEIIESWTGWEPMIDYAARNGFPEDQLRAALHSHPGFKYSAGWTPGLKSLQDDDVVQIGDYNFQCVVTPGHSRGHICLYEPAKKVLISGDHILGDITPNIQCWSDEENPLQDYLASLDKVGRLDADITLPGHRRLIENHRVRIEELKEHHARRLDEVRTILEEGPKHAFDVAALMSWDLKGHWDEFPLAQKWFATAEATSHLRYLEEAREIRRDPEKRMIEYSLYNGG